MKNPKKFLWLFPIVFLLLAGAWGPIARAIAVHALDEYSSETRLLPEEFCAFHSGRLAKASSLRNSDISLAFGRHRAVLKAWKETFLVQEHIDEETFQQKVRILFPEVQESNDGDFLRVRYVLLRDWYALDVFADVQPDGTYKRQHPDNPAYQVNGYLASLSCQKALDTAKPDADAQLQLVPAEDEFVLRSMGNSCKFLGLYTDTTLSLISGEVIYTKTQKAPGCAYPY